MYKIIAFVIVACFTMGLRCGPEPVKNCYVVFGNWSNVYPEITVEGDFSGLVWAADNGIQWWRDNGFKVTSADPSSCKM